MHSGAPGIFAAGVVPRWPDPDTGELVRIEHWAFAQRQGQVAARNMLGRSERFQVIPFFWTRQFGVSIKYVGHAEKWDSVGISGSLEEKDCAVTYKRNGHRLALATIGRDLENLRAEVEMEDALKAAPSSRVRSLLTSFALS
jgi:NADPH-dependent 2,4-dienoyl-CoA reductase/sulfur reductase-like enzyme